MLATGTFTNQTMSGRIFQDYGPYERLPATADRVDVPPGYSVETAPRDGSPTAYGSPGKTSRSGEPVSDRGGFVVVSGVRLTFE